MDAFLKNVNTPLESKNMGAAVSKVVSYIQLARQHPLLSAAGVTLAYILLCRSLRFRRINALKRRMGYATPKSMQQMTNVEAQTIIQQMAELEFPTMFKESLSFALFKVQTPFGPLLFFLFLDIYFAPERARD